MDTNKPVDHGVGVAVADNKPVSPAGAPDISRVEDLVAAVQQAAAQTTAPIQAPAETPQEQQFKAQFGSVQPSDAEAPIAQLDPSIKTVGDILAQGPQVVESQSEAKLPPKVQEFLDSVLGATEKYKASE